MSYVILNNSRLKKLLEYLKVSAYSQNILTSCVFSWGSWFQTKKTLVDFPVLTKIMEENVSATMTDAFMKLFCTHQVIFTLLKL